MRLFDTLLLLALLEQVLFEGQQAWVLPILLLFLLSTGLCTLFARRWKGFACCSLPRTLRAPAGLLVPSLCAGILVFGLLADRDLDRYLALANSSQPASALKALLSLAALLGLFSCAWRGAAGVNAARCVALLTSLLALGGWVYLMVKDLAIRQWALLANSSNQGESLLQPGLLTCYLLVCLRYALGSRPDSTSQAAMCWARTQFWLGLAALAAVGALAADSYFVVKGTPCAVASDPYPLNQQFVLHLLVAEDPLFLKHSGVDFQRLRKAAGETLTHLRYKRGGSTLSMQLAKVCYLSHEKTMLRKVRQIFLALALENKLSKQQILISYLERVPFAPQVIGLRAAALHFFQREPHNLTTDQGLQLVQSIFDPGHYNPSVAPMPAEVRRRRAVIAGRARAYAARLGEEVALLSVLRSSP